MLNIALFEDHVKDQQLLLSYASDFFKAKQISYTIDCYNSFPTSMEVIEKYDMIFLDIELGNSNGITFGHEIKQHFPDIIIIIISNYPKYLTDGYKINAKRYLLKPLRKELFAMEIEDVLSSTDFKQQYGFFNQEIAPFRLHYYEIIMIEALGRKTYVYLANHQVITCSYPLKKWIEQLSDKGFIQTHKAFLINLTHILNIQKDNDILLTDHKKAPLSRHFKQSFYDAYYQHVRTSL